MIAYIYITQHSFNITCHTKLPHLGMLKDFDVIFRWIHSLVQSNLLYVGFFHQGVSVTATVLQEVVTMVIGGRSNETDNRHAYFGFVSGQDMQKMIFNT